jgi:hypothetical protein
MSRLVRAAAPALVALLVVLLGAGCGDPCGDPEDRLVPLSELPCNATTAEGAWESHPLPPIDDSQCHWLQFRGCSEYEIAHPLGRTPSLVLGYISFDADGSFSTVGSGNSFVIEEANEQTIKLRNTQNQVFFLRLLLE